MALTARETKIYYVAKAADDAFQRELIRVYGAKCAPDMRYVPHKWADARLRHASDRFIRMNDKWIRTFRAANARTVRP